MKFKTLAVGMILPLIGTIALSTAPAASAATVTSHNVTHVNPNPNHRRAYRKISHHQRVHYRMHHRTVRHMVRHTK